MKTLKFLKNSALACFVFAFIFIACNNNKQQQEDLQKSVMATHDSVMKDMGNIIEKKMQIGKLLTNLDSLKAVHADLDTAKARVELNQTVKELVSADEEMMTWMHNFDPEYKGKSHEEIMKYLTDQKAKIKAVESSIKKVLIKSDSVMHNFE